MKLSGEKCSRLLIILFTCAGFLAASPIVHAATGDITAVRIVSSTCTAGISCNGWVAEIDIAGLNASGTYNFGLGTNNDPTNAKIVFTLTSPGYDTNGNATTTTRTVYGTYWLRKPYPNNAIADEATSSGYVTVRVGLSDFIYASDNNITANIGSGFYTQGGTPNNATTSIAVTNNSTQAYPSSVGRWATVAYQRETGPFTIEAVIFNRFARNGKPLAAVIFTCSDTHGNTVSSTVNNMTVSAQPGDQHAVLVYPATIPVSTLTQGDVVTCNFSAYPWIGNSGSVLTSNNGNTPPTELLAPLQMLNDKSGTYGLAFAVVDPANGHNSTANTWVMGTQSSAEAAYASSTANSYTTIGNAVQACKSYNNANYGRDEPGGCTVLLATNNNVYPGTSPGSTTGASNSWFTITRLSTVSRANAGITSGTITTLNTQKVHVTDITISGSSAAIMYSGSQTAGSGDVLWVDNNTINETSANPFYAWSLGYATDNTITACNTSGACFNSTSAQRMPFVLVRGNSASSASQGTGIPATQYAVVGNSNITSQYQKNANTAGNGISDNSIVAYNSVYNWTSQLANNDTAAINIGVGIVQNIFEKVASNVSPIAEIEDQSAANASNILLWHNTMVGSRIDQAYNYTGSNGPIYMWNWSHIGNIYENYNYNGDTSAPASSTHYGNMAVDYAVGQRYNYKRTSQSNTFPSFLGVFLGLNSNSGGTTMGFVNDAAYNDISEGGTDLGNGDYHLTSSSLALNLIPAGQAVLPFDIAGNPRSNNGTGAAGAYEYLDTTPPSVTWISPGSGTTVSSTITFTASSTDNVAVSNVTFYANGSVVGSSTVPSGSQYSVSWDSTSVANGSTTLMALAADTSNNTSSVSITVNVQNPPILRITTSTSLGFTAAHGSTATSTQAITVMNAGPPGSTLNWSATSTQSWLSFNPSSSSLASNATTSVLFNLNPTALALGTYNATATISAVSASSSPQLLSVSLVISPTGISTVITSPTNGGTVSGVTTVIATATSTAGISSVQFFLDGSPLGSAVTSSPYSVSWNTSLSSNGSHILMASSTDALANTATSSPITVAVNNGTGSTPTPVIVGVASAYGTPNYQGAVLLPPLSSSSSTPSSTSDLQALINSLTAQLQSLLAQAGQGSGASPTVFFVRNLSLWVTGNDVGDLQQFLIDQASGPAATTLKAHGTTTVFGMLTYNALKEFQKKVGIVPASGYFGPKTRAYVNAIEEESTAANNHG